MIQAVETTALALPDLSGWVAVHHVISLLRVCVLLLLGVPAFRMLGKGIFKLLSGRVSDQSAMLARKVIVYTGTALILVMSMRELGFKLTTLLGAAGLVGVAVGFAAQTSLSNLISGLFLVWEKPVQIGDVINFGDTSGVVHSIDLLSIKLRTFDNKFIRIPNESLIKSQFTNVTYFPIRRMDIDIGVAYKEDVSRVMDILLDVADKNPFCLDEPPPLVVYKGFGDSSLNLMLGIWFAKADFIKLRNSIMLEIKASFDKEGVEIPFPHRTLYAGSVTDPFPVRVVPPVSPDSSSPPHA